MTKRRFGVVVAAATLFLAAAALLLGLRQPKPTERTITIEAHKYGYTPGVIKVNKGDRITVRLKAKDVTHGFFLEGHDLDAKARPEMPLFWVRRPSTGEDYQTVEEVHFVADKEGKFRYRCSVTCGYMHPFMQGELIVRPNRLFPVSLVVAVAMSALTLLWFARGDGQSGAASHT